MSLKLSIERYRRGEIPKDNTPKVRILRRVPQNFNEVRSLAPNFPVLQSLLIDYYKNKL